MQIDRPAQESAMQASKRADVLLWRSWRDQGDLSARERLIELHLPKAKIIAATLYGKRYGNEIEFADYYQLATVGLLEAMDKFDPAREVPFRSFSEQRIRGAILDGLAILTEKHQQGRAKRRLQLQRIESLKDLKIQNEPSGQSSQSSQSSQLGSDEVFRKLADIGLGLALAWMLEDTGVVSYSEEASHNSPFYKSVELKQLQQRVQELVNSLPSQEKKVIRYHYLQTIPFEEIADIMAISRSRVSQIHRAALHNLKAQLGSRHDWQLAG